MQALFSTNGLKLVRILGVNVMVAMFRELILMKFLRKCPIVWSICTAFIQVIVEKRWFCSSQIWSLITRSLSKETKVSLLLFVLASPTRPISLCLLWALRWEIPGLVSDLIQPKTIKFKSLKPEIHLQFQRSLQTKAEMILTASPTRGIRKSS